MISFLINSLALVASLNLALVIYGVRGDFEDDAKGKRRFHGRRSKSIKISCRLDRRV